MRPRAFYNEIDPYCADWLENLIRAGLIAPGDVDRRDIRDVRPDDLRGYTQVHMFAGIGIWSLALREAGWPDDRPVWTGSCPCQPFSAAGQRGGFTDERHLWPAFHWLIEQCLPSAIIGEQVASPDGLRWLDLVQDDLEGAGYAFGAVDLCAAGACMDFAESEEGAATIEWIRGAVLSCPDPFLAAELRDFAAWAGSALGVGPAHIRQRLFWLAHSESEQRQPGLRDPRPAGQWGDQPIHRSATRPVADALPAGRSEGRSVAGNGQTACLRGLGELAHGGRSGLSTREREELCGAGRRGEGRAALQRGRSSGRDWIVCTDGRARPIESLNVEVADGIAAKLGFVRTGKGYSTSPLIEKSFARVGRLRAYGNSLDLRPTTQFVRAAIEAMHTMQAQSANGEFCDE